MTKRTKAPDSVQTEILVQSRRRCCICYGLNRDETVKRGQIAHVDGDPSNNSLGNLVYLCFDHHDEFDSRTSQSKGLLKSEVLKYREELYYHFGNWAARIKRDELLNFLAFKYAHIESLTEAAIEAAGYATCFGKEHAFDVLITDEVDYCDGDLYMPHISTLDYYASWGFLSFSYEEREVEDDDLPRVFISVKRFPVCDKIAENILESCANDPEVHARLTHLADYRGWRGPKSTV